MNADPSADQPTISVGGAVDWLATHDSSPPEEAKSGAGKILGRYVIVEQAGAGGMGRVYRAYDPKLRREVALKLLRSTRSQGIARIFREAQAMARLSHPNVVAVYDVEQSGEDVYITMEYVVGSTLRQWLEVTRSWHETVEMFRGAGSGLAAAHDAGLVHRDFKPSNVMVADDGRARVMDFGLARVEGDVDNDPSKGGASGEWSGSVSGSQPLTQAGLVMGTPPYMAPESHRGEEYDGRGDQFSFCVALFEALYGDRPFVAADSKGLLKAKLKGNIAVPARRDVPAWLHRVVMRGLSAQREDRYPTMAALLADLERVDAIGRRRSLAAFGGVAVLTIAVAFAFQALAARSELCSGAPDKLATAWDASQRERISTAFAATDKPYAGDAAAHALDGLDAYAVAWESAYEDNCRATQVRAEQPEALMDARARCLEGRLDQLRAVAQTLGEADAAVVERAATVIDRLPAVERCGDVDYVTAQVPPPDDREVAVAVDEQRRELARANALSSAGRLREALELAESVHETAEALDYLPLQVEAKVRLGDLHREFGEGDRAVAELEQAFYDGRRAHADAARIDAAIGLVNVLGTHLERGEPALQWAAHAEAEIDVAGDDSDRARLLDALGATHFHRGEFDEARASFEQALVMAERVHGERSTQRARALHNLGTILGATGKYEEARPVLERALEVRTEIHGAEHPVNVPIIENLGTVYMHLGRKDEALELHLRSLRIQEEAIGVDAPGVGETCINIAYDYMERLDYATARSYFERALSIFEDSLGADHPKTGHAHSTLSLALLHDGDPEAAIVHAERGAAIIEKAHGNEHPSYGAAIGRLSEAQLAAGRNEDAEASARLAIAVWSAKTATDNPELSFVLNRLGRALAAQGRHAEAVEPLERALALHNGANESFVADARMLLAESLWASGGDRPRARTLAIEARAGFERLGAPARPQLQTADAWLAAHR